MNNFLNFFLGYQAELTPALERRIGLIFCLAFGSIFALMLLSTYLYANVDANLGVTDPALGLFAIGVMVVLGALFARAPADRRCGLRVLVTVIVAIGCIGVYRNGELTLAVGTSFSLLLAILVAPRSKVYAIALGITLLPFVPALITPTAVDWDITLRVMFTLFSIAWPLATLIGSRLEWSARRWLAYRRLLLSGLLSWSVWLVIVDHISATVGVNLAAGAVVFLALQWIKRPPTILLLGLGFIPALMYQFALEQDGALAALALPMWILAIFLVLERTQALVLSGLLLISTVLTADIMSAVLLRTCVGTLVFGVILAVLFSSTDGISDSQRSRSPVTALSSGSLANLARAVVLSSTALLLFNLPFFNAGFSVTLDSTGLRWLVLQCLTLTLLSSGLWSYLRHRAALEREKERLAETLEQKLQEVQHANALAEDANRDMQTRQEKQAQIFSIIGHELRTPMASMKMMFDEMRMQQIEPYGQTLVETNNSLISILDDLRVIAEPERVKHRSAERVRPATLVERTVQSIRKLVESKGLSVEVSTDPGSNSLALLNPAVLRQIVTNLCKNAAIHSGGTKIKVRSESQVDADYLNFTLLIEDDGKGIPEEQRSELFGAFCRGDTKADGTGLGLFIIKDLVESVLGGDIEYFDSHYGGSGFKVSARLPLVADDETEVLAEEASSVNPLDGKRILFVEDTPMLQMLTKTMLEKAGAQVTLAANGQQALEIYAPSQFDVVLTDIMMPEMDGYALTRQLRERGFNQKIIGLTAAVIGKETEHLIQAGADTVLAKPVNLERLAEALL